MAAPASSTASSLPPPPPLPIATVPTQIVVEYPMVSQVKDGGSLISPVRPRLQKGPTCGLLALSIATEALLGKAVVPDELLEYARSKGLTVAGEMFHANSLAEVAEAFGLKSNVQRVTRTSLSDALSENLVLIPYDADKNHTPMVKKGLKPHWALLVGRDFRSDTVLALQGKSSHLQRWKIKDLLNSNLSLQGGYSGIPDLSGLRAQMVVLYRRVKLHSEADRAELELVSLVTAAIPKYTLKADVVTSFFGYKLNDSVIPSPALKSSEADLALSNETLGTLFSYFLLSGDRVSQMSKTYHDVNALTKLLEEKEKDVELAARIGQQLLERNKALEARVTELENELGIANEDLTQLRYQLQTKTELLQIYLSADDTESEAGTPVGGGSKMTTDIQKKIKSLEEDNAALREQSSVLEEEYSLVEAKERALIDDIAKRLKDSEISNNALAVELAQRIDENYKLKEEITLYLSKSVEANARIKELTVENEALEYKVLTANAIQLEHTTEIADLRDKYREVVECLHDTQEQLRRVQKSEYNPSLPPSPFPSYFNPESLAAELEESLRNEQDVHPACQDKVSKTIRRVFETVRCVQETASKYQSQFVAAGKSPIVGGKGVAPCSSIPFVPSWMTDGRTPQSFDSALSSDEDDFLSGGVRHSMYPLEPSVAVSGNSDLHDTLQKLNPGAVQQSRAKFGFHPSSGPELGLTYASPGPGMPPHSSDLAISELEFAISSHSPWYAARTPDSLMSTGAGSMYSTWKVPDRLRLVKPMEGSKTLYNWSLLATPLLGIGGALLQEREGVSHRATQIREHIGPLTMNSKEEPPPAISEAATPCDVDPSFKQEGGDVIRPIPHRPSLTSSFQPPSPSTASSVTFQTPAKLPRASDGPGKAFDVTQSVYTYTNSTVLHPDENTHLTQSLRPNMSIGNLSHHGSCSELAQAQLQSPNSAYGTPCATPSYSRRQSTRTFSTHLGIARTCQERGCPTPSVASLSPQGSPSRCTTPCNSPGDGTPITFLRGLPSASEVVDGIWSLSRRLRRTFVGSPHSTLKKKKKQGRRISVASCVSDTMSLSEVIVQASPPKLGLFGGIGADPISYASFLSRNSPMAQLTSLKRLKERQALAKESEAFLAASTSSDDVTKKKGVPGRLGMGDLRERVGNFLTFRMVWLQDGKIVMLRRMGASRANSDDGSGAENSNSSTLEGEDEENGEATADEVQLSEEEASDSQRTLTPEVRATGIPIRNESKSAWPTPLRNAHNRGLWQLRVKYADTGARTQTSMKPVSSNRDSTEEGYAESTC
ncbi:unnamed protein product [Cyprideis torosa]|uniref:Uncharacterized protein n=1 Tax=Cyprideis torosa TaxID=163714 RepID=A0A7R8W2D8_9CRUS|nr:unnamed protein product [Cyprideis torosa]CAG0881840.1 unnamed protein product [Cyprideis torosa]